ncbi:hypothetical protein [Streptomyces sp. MP131-18]|uniref:hypothetical protein n=1 Tax=Streptomyces sp. MP131-18 TaxID=1857892 RepID=UPI00097C576A|nr:hypothetical protein [Streptomyces sp. MP131-18]ONK15508.1 hypothetical protein STBA_63270 [Streptomyces sp. MP131-18]
MSSVIGLDGPIPHTHEQWLTVRGCKRVLVVAQTLTFAQRLLDIFPLLESDMRIEVHFTVAPHAFSEGVARFLHRLGSPVLPWREATATEFDLALAAGWEGIDAVRAPLVLLSHGAGHIKLQKSWAGGTVRERPPGMLSRDNLMRGDRLLTAALALAHRDELTTLARDCPEALPVATVVGDPAYDRLLDGIGHRDRYRGALGLNDGRKLVVVASTWGASASFQAFDALLPRLLSELPQDTFRTAVLPHPNIWAAHGWYQIRAWLAAYRRRGIAIIPPEVDWRAVLPAADWVIGDHGSLTSYATLIPVPILLARFPHAEVHHASPAAALAATAPVLSPGSPLEEQLDYARREYRRSAYARIAERISSEPGRFHRNMRSLMYRMLGIGEPACPPLLPPLPAPPPLDTWTHGAGDDAEVAA